MKSIAEIDRNFIIPEGVPENTLFYDPQEAPFSLWGIAPNAKGVYCRLPEAMLPLCNEGVQRLAYHLAGACVRFTTDANQLALIWQLRETANMPHFAASGQSGMELYEEANDGIRLVHNFQPAMNNGHGCKQYQSTYTALPGGMRHYCLYLPLYNGVKEFRIGLPEGAAVLPGRMPRIEKPVVFYGSSITQGGCACKAGGCYTTVLARRLDAAQINLGFSGSGRGESCMAEYIASLEMSAFVLDYDHNAPDAEHLQRTHEPFFRIVREKHPTLPIIMISCPDFDRNPVQNALRRDIIRRTYDNARAAGDENVYFIDGETLFGATDRDMCTVDGCHPNELGFLRMADGIEPVLRQALGV